MQTSLSIDDFKLFRAVCELRYDNAFLIYDRTGSIFHDLRGVFKDLRPIAAAPQQTAFQSDEGYFSIEIGASRFTAENPDSTLEAFASQCKSYLDAVCRALDLSVFTRIGLRVFFRHPTNDLERAKQLLDSMHITSASSQKLFGTEESPHEISLRWENDKTGATLRLKAESGAIDVVLPPELETTDRQIHKSLTGLLLDVDFYTVAAVDRDQWDPTAWIPQSFRRIKKEADKIITG